MNLLENLKKRLKQDINESEYSLWIEPIQFQELEKNILTLSFPNEVFVKKFNKSYKDLLKTYAKEILKTEITFSIIITPPLELESKPIQIPKIKHKKTFQEIRREKTTFDNTSKFRSQEELDTFINTSDSEDKEQKLQKLPIQLELIPMPGKYGISKVASFTSFDSRFFTYPTDKRLKSKVKIKFKYDDGTTQEYELYRGVMAFGDKGDGQLNTTHAKILLAIIHLWQKQGCKYVDKEGFFSVINISIRELAEQLGYTKIGGQTYQWLFQKVKEIHKLSNMLVLGNKGFGFSFITRMDVWNDSKDYGKTILSLSLHPFISKQLYERKAFLRNPEIYKIKNPIAFKFLICYDKKIFKGNSLKLSIKELAEDLQLESERTDNVVRTFKRAIKDLNNYELSENYILKVELIKENKKYFVTAERVNKKKRYNEKLKTNKIELKSSQGEFSL